MGNDRRAPEFRRCCPRPPYHFAVSTWTFYISQTRNSPPGECRQTLERAKAELRKLLDREQGCQRGSGFRPAPQQVARRSAWPGCRATANAAA